VNIAAQADAARRRDRGEPEPEGRSLPVSTASEEAPEASSEAPY